MGFSSAPAIDGGIWIKVRYDADFLDELKRTVPYGQRRWDPVQRRWWVSTGYALQALRLSERYFGASDDKADGDTDRSGPTSRPHRRGRTASRGPARGAGSPSAWPSQDLLAAYSTLGLPPGAGPDAVKRAHRRLAALHHPDRGGDLETMKNINTARDLLLDDARSAGRP
jgi:hypothetical protein